MAILTTQSTDSPSLGNLVDDSTVPQPLTDEIPIDSILAFATSEPKRLPRGQVFISEGWYFIR